MNRILGRWIGTMAAITTFTLPIQIEAQVPIHSTFQLGVYADANQNDFVSHTDFFATEQFATLSAFSHSLSVLDADNTNGGSLRVNSSASASWTDPGHGTVAWRGMGWVHDTYTSSGSKLNGFVISGPVWSYTFTATFDGQFAMNYDVRGTGNVFGLLGAMIEWSGPGGNLDLRNPYNPAANGVFTRPLAAGNEYTVGLSNNGNVFTAPIRRQDFGYMDADFNWNVSAVPEPNTVALFICGAAILLLRRTGMRHSVP